MNSHGYRHFFFRLFPALALLILSACSLQSTAGGNPNADVNQIVQQTFAALTQAAGGPTVDSNVSLEEPAKQTEVAQAVAQTVAAMASSTAEFTLTPEFTPTLTLTPTSETVQVSVSVETNCRSGPGPAYNKLGILKAGQTAQVVGRNSFNDTWIIQLPSDASVTCWLWGQYATVTGNWQALPVFTPPPTPTPASKFEAVYSDTKACASPVYWFINLQILNTGNTTWESVYVKLTDEDTPMMTQMAYNDFPRWGMCGVLSFDDNLAPGEIGYAGYAFTANPIGHTVTAEVKVCSQDGLAGTCLSKVITFIP